MDAPITLLRDDHVRECKYFCVEEINDELIGDEEGNTILKSDAPKELLKKWEEEAESRNETLKRRDVVRKKVWIYMIVGDEVVSKDLYGAERVPIIPWVGVETVIDGQFDRHGHTRALGDPQRMLNYNRYRSMKMVLLQSKANVAGTHGYSGRSRNVFFNSKRRQSRLLALQSFQ